MTLPVWQSLETKRAYIVQRICSALFEEAVALVSPQTVVHLRKVVEIKGLKFSTALHCQDNGLSVSDKS